jgi:hypothetical protein
LGVAVCRLADSFRSFGSTQPVLAVIGADSHTLWPGWVEVHNLTQAWLPRSEAFVLAGATHGLQMMNPQGMAAGLAGFF